MRTALPGRAFGQAQLEWQRGPAKERNGVVYLEPGAAEPYYPSIRGDHAREGDLLIDVANLAHPDRAPRDGVTFATRHGLLLSEADAGNWERWRLEARLVALALGLYADLSGYARNPTRTGLRQLRTVWGKILALGRPDLPPPTDEEMPSRMGDAFVSFVNRGLEGTAERLAVLVDESGQVAGYVIEPKPPHLLALAWHQMVLLATLGVEMRACQDPACGRFYVVVDRRSLFCTPAHGERLRSRNRARDRRAQEKEAHA